MTIYSIVGQKFPEDERFESFVDGEVLLQSINLVAAAKDDELATLLSTIPSDVALVLSAISWEEDGLLRSVAFDIVAGTLHKFSLKGLNVVFGMAATKEKATQAFENEMQALFA